MGTEPEIRDTTAAERERRRFEQLHRAGLELAGINEPLQLAKAYQAVLAIVAAEQHCHAVIRRYDPASSELILAARVGESDQPRFERLPLTGLQSVVARERRTVVILDADRSPDSALEVHDSAPHYRSLIVTPITFEGSYYGNLILSHEEVNYFRNHADVMLIEGLALQLGVTVHRAEEVEALRNAERRAAEAEALSWVGQQAYEIAHRLGNALGLVPSLVRKVRKILAQSGKLEPAVEIYLNEILQGVDTVMKLSRDLNERLAREYDTAMLSVVTVSSLVTRAIESARAVLDNVEVDVQQIVQPSPLVKVAPEQILAALVNIVANAIEAMPNGGKLVFGAISEGPSVQLWVQDSGGGIDPAKLPNLFNLFYSTKPGSAGFGLWSAQRLVMANGGSIRVESELGSGTKVILSLPRATTEVDNG